MPCGAFAYWLTTAFCIAIHLHCHKRVHRCAQTSSQHLSPQAFWRPPSSFLQHCVDTFCTFKHFLFSLGCEISRFFPPFLCFINLFVFAHTGLKYLFVLSMCRIWWRGMQMSACAQTKVLAPKKRPTQHYSSCCFNQHSIFFLRDNSQRPF